MKKLRCFSTGDYQKGYYANRHFGLFAFVLFFTFCFHVDAQAASPIDNQVRVTFSGFVLNRTTKTFDTVANITNISTVTFTGPISLVITSLTPTSATLSNSTGTTTDGNPYLNVPVPAGGLSPGGSISNILLKLSNPSVSKISLTTSVLASISNPTAPVPLTISKSGTGGGTITSDPPGINCGTTCQYSFNNGSAVILTAAPDASSTFNGWSGACTGIGTCGVTMSQSRTVSASFDTIPLPLVEGIQAEPFSIAGATPTLVTVTATMSETLVFLKNSVTLWRYDNKGNPIANLGQMFDDGTQGDAVSGDNVFTKQITLNEAGPGYVALRVSADVAPQQTTISSESLVPVSVVQLPADVRSVLVANLRTGNLTAAYNQLGNTFNDLTILDNMPVNLLSGLADALSTCNVVEQTTSVQICVGSIVINGQFQELRFFLVKDVVGTWRVIGW